MYKFIFLLCIFLLCGCAVKELHLTEAGSRAARHGIVEGIYKEHYRNGKLKFEVVMHERKPNGLGKAYLADGTLVGERYFVDGVIEGQFRDYYSTGELRVVGNAKDGKKNGFEKKFYKSGKLFEEIYYKEGLAEGEARTYYENGKIKYLSYLKENKFEWVNEYDEDGILINEKKFDN